MEGAQQGSFYLYTYRIIHIYNNLFNHNHKYVIKKQAEKDPYDLKYLVIKLKPSLNITKTIYSVGILTIETKTYKTPSSYIQFVVTI